MSASADPTKSRDSYMKMLLTTVSKNLDLEANSDRDIYQNEENLHETFVSYIQAITGSSKRIPLVWMEHSYARSGGRGCGVGIAAGGGTKLLLVRQPPKCPDCHGATLEDDDVLDVESFESEPPPPLLLDEIPSLENGLGDEDMVAEDEEKPDWEEKLRNLAWSSSQSHLLEGTLSYILSARVALLTVGAGGARRAAALGGASRSLRHLLASPPTRWQTRLVQWLHNVLIEHLPAPLLACYKDIMLTLKSKTPILVERMTMGHPLSGRVRGAENGAGGPTIASGSNQPSDPGVPLLLLIPSGRCKRDARWAERLRAVGQVHVVHSHQSNWPARLPLSACLAQLVGAGRARASSLRSEHPHRPLVLVGQGAGASIAVQLAVSVAGVAGLVCLGLPLLTADGPRGTHDDCILDIPCPTLFVIGQNGCQSTQQDVEELRCKLRVRSRLVVAGGADDLLRLPRLKRHIEGVTQRMVECAIADEVGNFLKCLGQWEGESGGRSSPDSMAGEEDSRLTILTPPIVQNTPRSRPLPPAKRRLENIPNALPQPPKKRVRVKKPKPDAEDTKSTSPIKSRGKALFKVNNPPPEGATISMGQLLSKGGDDGITLDNSNNLSPPSKRQEHNSFLQISNNVLSRTHSLSGNGTPDNSVGGHCIKVLENIPFKVSKLLGSRLIGNSSGTQKPTMMLSSRRNQLISQGNQLSPISSTNIMDIPIIFADDNKSIGNQPNQNTLTKQGSQNSNIKTIIINKQQMIKAADNDIHQSGAGPSQQLTQRNIVQIKMPPGGGNSSNQIVVNSSKPPTISVKRGAITNSTLQYLPKYIIAKKISDIPKSVANSDGSLNDISDSTKPHMVSNKPIIVKGKGGPLTTIKMIPGTVFHKSPNMLKQSQPLIIKRAVTPSTVSGNSLASIRKRSEIMKKSMANDRAIEAAVASITGDPDNAGN